METTGQDKPGTKTIVIFGGSQFMGLTLIEALSAYKQFDVYVVNRGNSYWSGKNVQLINTSKNLTQISANRNKKEFAQIVCSKIPSSIDMIIDFSCYDESDLQKGIQVVKQTNSSNTCLYVLISTDSSYDASAFILSAVDESKNLTLNTPTKLNQAAYSKYQKSGIPETCGIYEENKFLKSQDSYGYKKLQCEQILMQSDTIQKFVALRLADVIGPYDESFRLWKYISLLTLPQYKDQPLQVSRKDTLQKLSFTYSKDVVQVILQLALQNQKDYADKKQIFNLACKEQVTLEQFLQMIKQVCAQEQGKQIQIVENGLIKCKFYPSVDCGPIDVSKIQREVFNQGIQLTPLMTALLDAVGFCFYAQMYNAYPKEYKKMIAEIERSLKDQDSSSESSSSDS